MAAPIPMLARQVRNDIVAYFESAGATAPERAIAFDPVASGFRHPLVRDRMARRMRAFGVLREPTPGRFYLDHAQLTAFVARTRFTALGIVAAMGAAVATAMALGG